MKIMSLKVRFLLLAFFVVSFRAYSAVSIDLEDGVALRLGGDIRLRYEGYTQSVLTPDADKAGRHATKYLRNRTRLWGSLDFGPDVTVNLRLGNRVHRVFSSPNPKNNRGSATWEFPDEVFIDSANVEIRNLLDGMLMLRIGRQDLSLGKGLFFREGTPFDQGRSVYCDGIFAKFDLSEKDKLSFFTFFDTWRDRLPVIRNRHRRLRSGNVFTTGLYWEHHASNALNYEFYYVFNDLDDRQPTEAERGFRPDESVSLHSFIARMFGQPNAYVDYSMNYVQQAGRDAAGRHLDGYMLDAYVNFHLMPESELKPIIGLDITRFSGDKNGTKRNNGVVLPFAESPLWGEELIPIMTGGNWANLDLLKIAASISPTKNLALSCAFTQMFACEKYTPVAGHQNSGGGSDFGRLLEFAAKYTFNDMISAQCMYSYFMPGNFFQNGHDGSWARAEMVFRF